MSRNLFIALALVISGAAAWTPSGFAAGSTAAPTQLKLDTSSRFDNKGAKVPGQFILNVTLTTADAKPISDREVHFFQNAELFGPRDALVGTAATDAAGHASLLFQPAETGPVQLKAEFPGDTQFSPQSAMTSLTVTVATSPYKEHPLPLAPVAGGLTWGVCIVAVSVWLVLFGILLRTALGIRAVGRAAKGGRPVA